MPNLRPPVTTAEQALSYRSRILEAVPPAAAFQPLMTLYLTDATPPAEIARAKATGHIAACKLYPAGATTVSYTHLDVYKRQLHLHRNTVLFRISQQFLTRQ